MFRYPGLLKFACSVFFFFSITALLPACGGGGGGGASGDGSGDNNSGTTFSCETKSNHQNHNGADCAQSGCHSSGFKPMSYAGSAPLGSTITIQEDSTGTTYYLPVNTQGNFCLRSKNGGSPTGGYTATLSTPMISHQVNGSCNTTGCHDAGRPIF